MQTAKKIIKITIWLAGFFFLAMFAGVVGERWAFPWLSSFPFLSRFEIFQKFNEKTTIINKTEQILVKEEVSVSKVAEKVSSSLVKILAIPESSETPLIRINQNENSETRSGLLITSDGLIMSVVDQETGRYFSENKNLNFKILFPNGELAEANFVKYDSYSDLVFFKIEKAGNWAIPVWGESDRLANGERVLVCSADKENSPKLVVDFISSKEENFSLLNSPLSFSEKMEGVFFLSSGQGIEGRDIGSPVINSDGEVVGLVSQLEKNNEKKSFILPLKSIEKIIERAVKGQSVKQPQLGVYYLPINKELATKNNLPAEAGALVYSFSGQQGLAVLKNSAADKAGIKIGDILVSVNENKINETNSLSALINRQLSGDKIEVGLIRNGKEQKVEVVLD